MSRSFNLVAVSCTRTPLPIPNPPPPSPPAQVRKDIGEFRSSAGARMDPLLRERAAATGSLRGADNILSGAASTLEALKGQRQPPAPRCL